MRGIEYTHFPRCLKKADVTVSKQTRREKRCEECLLRGLLKNHRDTNMLLPAPAAMLQLKLNNS